MTDRIEVVGDFLERLTNGQLDIPNIQELQKQLHELPDQVAQELLDSIEKAKNDAVHKIAEHVHPELDVLATALQQHLKLDTALGAPAANQAAPTVATLKAQEAKEPNFFQKQWTYLTDGSVPLTNRIVRGGLIIGGGYLLYRFAKWVDKQTEDSFVGTVLKATGLATLATYVTRALGPRLYAAEPAKPADKPAPQPTPTPTTPEPGQPPAEEEPPATEPPATGEAPTPSAPAESPDAPQSYTLDNVPIGLNLFEPIVLRHGNKDYTVAATRNGLQVNGQEFAVLKVPKGFKERLGLGSAPVPIQVSQAVWGEIIHEGRRTTGLSLSGSVKGYAFSDRGLPTHVIADILQNAESSRRFQLGDFIFERGSH